MSLLSAPHTVYPPSPGSDNRDREKNKKFIKRVIFIIAQLMEGLSNTKRDTCPRKTLNHNY